MMSPGAAVTQVLGRLSAIRDRVWNGTSSIAGAGAVARRRRELRLPFDVARVSSAVGESAALRYAPYAALAAMLAGFGWWYGSVLLSVPIFGDATIHAQISRGILENGVWDTPTTYPSAYHLAGAVFLSIGGDTGFRLFAVFALLLLAAGVYVLSREVTGSHLVSLSATMLALIAPQTIFYTGRLYMEVLLSAFIVWAVVFVARYLRIGSWQELLACAVFTALAASTKQQGLVLLAPAVGLALVGRAALAYRQEGIEEAKRRAQHVVAFAVIVGVITVPAYLSVMHSTGGILPETGPTAWVNKAARTITGWDGAESLTGEWSARINDSFNASERGRGFVRAEERHVWPTDVFTSARGFFGIHTLFCFDRDPFEYGDAFVSLILGLFSLGVVVWAVRTRRWMFAGFLGIFLVFNYLSFVRNNDQLRYHMYVSFILAFLVPYGLTALGAFGGRTKVLSTAALLSLLGFAVFLTVDQFPSRIERVERFAGTQAYAGSVGGMASIIEAGDWLEANTEKDEAFFAVPSTEFQYYADRPGIYTYGVYFLERDELRRVFDDWDVTHIVVANSAVQADHQWNNVVKMPASFSAKILALYPIVYTTSAGDVTIFEVR